MTEQCCQKCPYTPQLVHQVLRANRSCSDMAEAVEAVLKQYAARPVWSGMPGVTIQSAKLYWSTMAVDIESAILSLPVGDRLDAEKIARKICPFGGASDSRMARSRLCDDVLLLRHHADSMEA